MTGPADRTLRVAHPDKLFIGGRWVSPSSNARLRLVNPATEEVFFEIAEAREADIETAVAAAREAFDRGPWPRTPPSQRAAKMRALAQAIARRAASFERATTLQIGLPVRQSTGGAVGPAALLNYYADLAESYVFEDVRTSGGSQSKVAVVRREPVGVAATVAPWNGPLMTMMMKLAPALAAGCTTVVKPAPETPIEAFILAEAVEEVGFPDGVFNLAPADRQASEHLVSHAGVDKVAFTGSTAAGLRIAAICAARMARYTMELGGKSAAIVLEDFDPARFGPTFAPLLTRNSGQACTNYSRVLVPRRRYKDYVESLAAAMADTRVGDPLDPTVWMGPLAMRRQLDRVLSYIDKGLAEGARIATGGGRPKHMPRGFYVEPTLFADAANTMTVSREEIFGPVTAAIPYDDEDHAIQIANDSTYGLSGGVYTDDLDRAYAIAQRVRSGHFTQNGREFDMTNPFGGVKQSGCGREGGVEGILPYLETKTVFLPGIPNGIGHKS